MFEQVGEHLAACRELAARELPDVKRDAMPVLWRPGTSPDTNHQFILLFWYNQLGLCAVARRLTGWAEARAKKSSQKKQYETLMNNQELVFYHLTTLPPPLIEPSICNTLDSRLQDADFR
jgi:hypothetical protein